MFGYSDLVVDPRNLVLMRDAKCPVTADVTHSLQQPAGAPRPPPPPPSPPPSLTHATKTLRTIVR